MANDIIDSILNQVIANEGGYVNDPNDEGGATKYGIATNFNKEALKKLGVSDVKDLTIDQAKEIYRNKYVKPSKLELVPDEAKKDYFDAYVNSPKRAIKALQKSVGATADGVFGNKTKEALLKNQGVSGLDIKRNYVSDIIDSTSDSNLKNYINGWMNRYLETDEFGSDKIDLRNLSRDEIKQFLLVSQSPEPEVPSALDSAVPPIQNYTVEPGDTLYGISRKLNVPVNDLVSLNGINNPEMIQPGLTLNY